MTRFTLYHTVTDTLGRVQGEIYTLDEQIHQDELKTLKMPLTDVEEVTTINKAEWEIARYRKLKRKMHNIILK